MKYSYLFLLLFITSCHKEFVALKNELHTSEIGINNQRPNIILLVIDDMGYEVPQFTGGQSYETPNLNAIANSSMFFTQCHSAPSCCPSRTMLLSGKYNFRNYIRWGEFHDKTIANLLQRNGYRTGAFGKWQLGQNGDTSMHELGFQEGIVHDCGTPAQMGYRYRNPHLYAFNEDAGGYIDDALTYNQYGDDIVQDSLFQFMKRSKQIGQPFFAYYPMILNHQPMQPTPDDPEFLTFDIDTRDSTYYPSMVKYMDKLIGTLIERLDKSNLFNNTAVFIVSDNGTPGRLLSLFNGDTIIAGKGRTTEYGTNIPLLVKWGNHSMIGKDSSLIDFTDFFPTICDIAGISRPPDYGIIDGISFYHNIVGKKGFNRDWIFNDYWPHKGINDHYIDDNENDDDDTERIKHVRWVQNTTYKLYDSVVFYPRQANDFLNFTVDKYELYNNGVIDNPKGAEKKIYESFKDVLNKMH